MRGFKNEDSARTILEGYVVNYNKGRPPLSLKGRIVRLSLPGCAKS